MKSFCCPHCLVPFANDELFCKRCGIRKGAPFSNLRWCLIAILITLLLLSLFIVVEKMRNMPVDLLFHVIIGLLLLLPIPCMYQFSILALLRRRGLVTKGIVTERYKKTVSTNDRLETRCVSVVEFKADIASPITCRVEATPLKGYWPPMYSQVDVVYDPYAPESIARIGTRPSLFELIMPLLFSLLFACIPPGIMIGLLLTSHSSTP